MLAALALLLVAAIASIASVTAVAAAIVLAAAFPLIAALAFRTLGALFNLSWWPLAILGLWRGCGRWFFSRFFGHAGCVAGR